MVGALPIIKEVQQCIDGAVVSLINVDSTECVECILDGVALCVKVVFEFGVETLDDFGRVHVGVMGGDCPSSPGRCESIRETSDGCRGGKYIDRQMCSE